MEKSIKTLVQRQHLSDSRDSVKEIPKTESRLSHDVVDFMLGVTLLFAFYEISKIRKGIKAQSASKRKKFVLRVLNLFSSGRKRISVSTLPAWLLIMISTGLWMSAGRTS